MLLLKCQVCGCEMEAQKSTKKYCSRACENKAKLIRLQENKNKPKNAAGMVEKECTICGKKFFPKTAAANQRKCCYECFPDGKQLLRSDFLNVIRKNRGGECERCGYNNYLGALDFHHVDPNQKDFTIGDRNFKLEECVQETKKCVMICSNCHREVHAGLWNIEDILKEKEEVEPDGINKTTV